MPVPKLIIIKSELLQAKARLERYRHIKSKVNEIHNKANNLTEADMIFFEQVVCQIYNYDYTEYAETKSFVLQVLMDEINKFE